MIVIKDGWLKDEILATLKEYDKLPAWLKLPEDQINAVSSYSDI